MNHDAGKTSEDRLLVTYTASVPLEDSKKYYSAISSKIK